MSNAPGFATHPGHRVKLAHARQRVRMIFNGVTVADTEHPLIVDESGYEPVFYFPEGDIRRDCLAATAHQTHCPFKGEARYWTLTVDDRSADNAVWSYQDPYDETADLKGYYAFYTDKLDRVEAESQ